MSAGFFQGKPLSGILPILPKRIVSLVPSQTELLYDLGLEAEIVGITKFCVHPREWFRTKARVGGTKTVSIEKVKSLRPDLILANKEENVKEQIEALSEIAPVWVSNIKTFEDALEMIAQIGIFTGTEIRANAIMKKINSGFAQLEARARKTKTIAYLIWRNPWMAVGSETFINSLFPKIGLKNVFGNQDRYPEITLENLKQHNPDLILLSSEPFPFKEKHIEEVQKAIPNREILLVDGEMFSWYGSRLQLAPAYFQELFR